VSEEQVINKLKQRLGTRCFLEEPFTRGIQTSMRIDKECLKDAIEFLKNNEFTHLSAITGFEVEDGIELLYHLSNGNTLLTIRIKLPKNEAVAPSITNVIRGATLYEQEIHDLLGVKFAGHPNLERLILPDDWPADNYPLRKSRTVAKDKKRKHSRNSS
jgi:NADH-quinone oxidoreductase subunit C